MATHRPSEYAGQQRTLADADRVCDQKLDARIEPRLPEEFSAWTLVQLCEQSIVGRRLSPVTVAMYESICRRSIAPYFTTKPAAEIRSEDIAVWADWMTTDCGFSQGTVARNFGVASAAYNWAHRAGLFSANPCRRIQLLRPDRTPHVPAQRAALAIGSGAAGNTTGHHRSITVHSRLRAAIDRTDARDTYVLFQHAELD